MFIIQEYTCQFVSQGCNHTCKYYSSKCITLCSWKFEVILSWDGENASCTFPKIKRFLFLKFSEDLFSKDEMGNPFDLNEVISLPIKSLPDNNKTQRASFNSLVRQRKRVPSLLPSLEAHIAI